jgi:hypothetical protein
MTFRTYSDISDTVLDGFSACLEIIQIPWLKIVLDVLDGIDYFTCRSIKEIPREHTEGNQKWLKFIENPQ